MDIARYKDYFSFETIRDKNGEVICYHITMIGTVVADGVARPYETEEKKMAFGALTLHDQNRRIGVLLDLLNARTYYQEHSYLEGNVNMIRYTAHRHHVEEVQQFEEGDRVLIEGRAYLRESRNEEIRPELTVTVSGTFRLGRRRVQRKTAALIPQE